MLIIIIFHSGDHLQQQHAAIARSSDAGRGIAAAMTQSAWPLNTVFASTWRSVRMLTIVSLLFLTSGTDARCHGTLDCLTVSLSPPGVPSPATHFSLGSGSTTSSHHSAISRQQAFGDRESHAVPAAAGRTDRRFFLLLSSSPSLPRTLLMLVGASVLCTMWPIFWESG